MSFGASAAGSAPSPPRFKPVKLDQATDLAQKYDSLGYSLTDQAFLSQYPGLVAIRDSQINDAARQVVGPLDPTVQGQFARNAMSTTLDAFGGGTGSIGEAGSAARGSIAASIANQTQTKQDADRLNLENLMGLYPQRQFGLTGGDLTNIMIGNITGQNQANYQQYAAQVQNANASSAASASNTASTVQLGISLAGLVIAI